MTLSSRSAAVTLANEKVPIVIVCNLIGMDLPDGIGYGRSVKVHCPFGEIYHRDGGHETAFRIYSDSNSAYCFAGCGYFTPTWLAAQAWGQQPADAAISLLDRVGIKPISLAQAWAQAAVREVPPDTTLLGEALKTYCRRTAPDWAQIQFHPPVAAILTRCLTLLDLVHTDADAARWLAGCKHVMATALRRS